jgi:competence protein ComEC
MTRRSLGHRAPLLWLVLPMLAGLSIGQNIALTPPAGLLIGAGLATGVALATVGRPRLWATAMVAAMSLAGWAAYGLHRARLPAWDALPPREARLSLEIERTFAPNDPRKVAGLATVLRADEHLRELAGQRIYFSLALKKGESPPVRTARVTVTSSVRSK